MTFEDAMALDDEVEGAMSEKGLFRLGKSELSGVIGKVAVSDKTAISSEEPLALCTSEQEATILSDEVGMLLESSEVGLRGNKQKLKIYMCFCFSKLTLGYNIIF